MFDEVKKTQLQRDDLYQDNLDLSTSTRVSNPIPKLTEKMGNKRKRKDSSTQMNRKKKSKPKSRVNENGNVSASAPEVSSKSASSPRHNNNNNQPVAVPVLRGSGANTRKNKRKSRVYTDSDHESAKNKRHKKQSDMILSRDEEENETDSYSRSTSGIYTSTGSERRVNKGICESKVEESDCGDNGIAEVRENNTALNPIATKRVTSTQSSARPSASKVYQNLRTVSTCTKPCFLSNVIPNDENIVSETENGLIDVNREDSDVASPIEKHKDDTNKNVGLTMTRISSAIRKFLQPNTLAILLILVSFLLSFWRLQANSLKNHTEVSESINVEYCSEVQGFEMYCGKEMQLLESITRESVKQNLAGLWESLKEEDVRIATVSQQIRETTYHDGKESLDVISNKMISLMRMHENLATKTSSINRDSNENQEKANPPIHRIQHIVGRIKGLKRAKTEKSVQVHENLSSLHRRLDEDIISRKRLLPPLSRENSDGKVTVNFEPVTRSFFDEALSNAIETFHADGTGLHDISLISGGAHLLRQKQFTSFVDFNTGSLETVFSSTQPVRDCYSFIGSQGNVSVMFPYSTMLRGFAIEHGTKELQALHSKASAPRHFAFFGLKKNAKLRNDYIFDDYQEVYFGEFTYFISERYSRIQYYTIPKGFETQVFDAVKIQVLSNYGDGHYTCLHRIRVLT